MDRSPNNPDMDTDNNNYTLEEEIELINCIVDCAIEHGGDMGGSYYSAGKTLCEALQEWLDFRSLSDDYLVESTITGDYERGCRIIRKTSISC